MKLWVYSVIQWNTLKHKLRSQHSFLNSFLVTHSTRASLCFFLDRIKQSPRGSLRTWDPETGNSMALVLITIQGKCWMCWLLFLTLMCCISAYLTRCDFNNNSRPFCDWTQPCNVNQGVWIRTKHDTPTDGTGPDGDYPDGSKCSSVALLVFLFWRQPNYLYSFFFEREKRFMKPSEMCLVCYMLTPVFDFSSHQTGVI